MDQATQETFREFLKNSDRLIKERKFDEAKAQLAEAKKLYPKSPYIAALEVLIDSLEKNPKSAATASPNASPAVTKPTTAISSTLPTQGEHEPVALDLGDQKIRHQIEEEYKSRLSQELQKAEEEAKKVLEEERTKLERLRSTLKSQYDQRIADNQKRLEGEYEKKLRDWIAKAEKQLDQQPQAEELEQKHKTTQRDLKAELQSKLHDQSSEEQKLIQQEAHARLEAENKRLQEEYDAMVVEQNNNIQKIRAELQNEMKKMSKQYEQKMEFLGTKAPKTKEEAIQVYRNKMRECYVNGEPTVENAKRLMELSELMGLTFDEHLTMESEVRIELYVSNVEKWVMSGGMNLKNTQKLEELKQQFHITPEDASRLESYILSSIERLSMKGRILIADDDEPLLKALEKTVSSDGYQVIACGSVAQALEKLKTTAVDLILSDIQFLNQPMDGFQFFGAVQQQPHLRKIPFVFLSQLADGVMIASGKKLGADDYLTKPLDPDLLFAVIEGKLKRYRSLDRN